MIGMCRPLLILMGCLSVLILTHVPKPVLVTMEPGNETFTRPQLDAGPKLRNFYGSKMAPEPRNETLCNATSPPELGTDSINGTQTAGLEALDGFTAVPGLQAVNGFQTVVTGLEALNSFKTPLELGFETATGNGNEPASSGAELGLTTPDAFVLYTPISFDHLVLPTIASLSAFVGKDGPTVLRMYWPLFTLLGTLNVAEAGVTLPAYGGVSFSVPDQMVMEAACEWDLLDFSVLGQVVQVFTDAKVGSAYALLHCAKHGCNWGYKYRCCEEPKPEQQQWLDACEAAAKECPCGWFSCLPTPGVPLTKCCAAGYNFTCCKKPPPPPPPSVAQLDHEKNCTAAKENCSCKWASCIEKKGEGASPCCAANYVFTCCVEAILQMELCKKAFDKACDCHWGSCIKQEGIGATDCCAANYNFTCCQHMLPMQQQQMSECRKAYEECKPCGWANCIPDAGTAATPCCAANYAFKCCTEKPPQTTPIPRQLEELEQCEKARKKCPYRMSKCVPKRGQPAGTCCTSDHIFTCLKPSFVWDKKTALELLQIFQKKRECKGKKSFCICEGPYFAQNRAGFGSDVPHRLTGTCCDDSSECQCCWTDEAIVRLPTLHNVADTNECKTMIAEEEKCTCAHAHHPDYSNLVPHSCVKEEVWPESPCCEEGYRFECCAYPEMDVQNQVARVLCDAKDPKSNDCTAIGHYATSEFDCDHAPEINSICYFNFLVARKVIKPTAITQKPVLTLCKGRAKECPCGHASCVFTGVVPVQIEACCDGLYEFKCCAEETGLTTATANEKLDSKPTATALTTTTENPSGIYEKGKCKERTEIKKICKTCDFYSCIRREGYASSICCAEHYDMTCCVGEQVPTSTTKFTTMQTTLSTEMTTTMAKTTTMSEISTNPKTKKTSTTVEDPIYAERNAAGPPMQCLIKAVCTKTTNTKPSYRFKIDACDAVLEKIKKGEDERINALGLEFLEGQGPIQLKEYLL
uniref:Uncharacterized protein n=1 Tax=Globodera rostochiensis TaxID=31243 RepID=A0A914H800_GLORO